MSARQEIRRVGSVDARAAAARQRAAGLHGYIDRRRAAAPGSRMLAAEAARSGRGEGGRLDKEAALRIAWQARPCPRRAGASRCPEGSPAHLVVRAGSNRG
jgi:hypothetical protein